MCGGDGSCRRALDAFEEEIDPGFPVALLAHAIEQLVVAAAVLLEEQAQIEQRLLQHASLDQHQHDQQPAQATIAVQKRVDGLELHVGQGGPHQHRQGVRTIWSAMDEVLQLAHARTYQPLRRWHEAGVARPGAADPLLTAPELAGQPIGSAAPGQ